LSDLVRTVERSLDILLSFTARTPELSMTDIAERVGLHKSTTHRLLATLERRRFVERHPGTGLYRLGLQVARLAHVALDHDDLFHLALPYLRRLNEESRENVHLTVLDGTNVVYVHVIEGHGRVKLAAAPGQSLPATATASGKAILAFLPEDELRGILGRGMPRYTTHTIRSVEAFLEDAQRTRERGYAVGEREFENEIAALAAPVLDVDSRPVASVSIAGPAYRLTDKRILELAPRLLSAVHELSLELQKTGPARAGLSRRRASAARPPAQVR
jgi:IclR family transcriptional regulator, KDG regulon repressor